jgi:hypothetical protein
MDFKAKQHVDPAEDDEEGSGLLGSRSRLVRVPRGADTTIFGGWGIKI